MMPERPQSRPFAVRVYQASDAESSKSAARVGEAVQSLRAFARKRRAASRQQGRANRKFLFYDSRMASATLQFIEEEPLQIFVQEKPYLVTMRTPGMERELAAGLCLSEGLVEHAGDIERIGYDELMDPNRVDVWLLPEALGRARRYLARGRLPSLTSCGICGKRLITQLVQKLRPVEKQLSLGVKEVLDTFTLLEKHQRLYPRTRSAHAALILDGRLRKLSFAEDVGRHNALDKAIGKLLLQKRLAQARVAVLSSRVSYELVQKAARSQLEMIVSVSRPTGLALKLAQALGITLAFSWKGTGLAVACGTERIHSKKA